jgi:hypothetical protein
MSCQVRAPTALPPGNESLYQLNRRLGESQSRSGRFGEKKLMPLPGFELRIVRSSRGSRCRVSLNNLSKTGLKKKQRQCTDALPGSLVGRSRENTVETRTRRKPSASYKLRRLSLKIQNFVLRSKYETFLNSCCKRGTGAGFFPPLRVGVLRFSPFRITPPAHRTHSCITDAV